MPQAPASSAGWPRAAGRDTIIDTTAAAVRRSGPRPRLLACDIDGTLLDPSGHLRPVVRDAVRLVAQSGVHVMLATGRSPWAGMADLAAELGLQGPQVAMQGAIVSDPSTGRIEHAVPLAPALYAEVLAFAAALDLDPVVALTDGLGARRTEAVDFPDELRTTTRLRTTDDLAAFATERPLRVFLNTPPARHQHVLAAASVWFAGKASLVWSDARGVDVLAPGVTKWTGVSFMADRLGIPHDAVAAVGDAPNDIGMLRAAGCSVAMGSAPVHVRNLADVVVLSSDQDGIVDALAWFFPDLAVELGRPATSRYSDGLRGGEAIAAG